MYKYSTGGSGGSGDDENHDDAYRIIVHARDAGFEGEGTRRDLARATALLVSTLAAIGATLGQFGL